MKYSFRLAQKKKKRTYELCIHHKVSQEM